MDGVLVINKPVGLSSHDVVQRVRKILNEKKCGHTGTLDPLASGVMLVCLGEATKLSNYLMSEEKAYEATINIGFSTTTYDLEGEITKQVAIEELDTAKLDEVLFSFKGESLQLPPIYSAIKKDGKKLYEYALENKEIKLEPRRIFISSIKRITPIKFEDGCARFLITTTVSKGTYIRSLAYDIGQTIGYPSCLIALKRIMNSGYTIDDSYTLDDLVNGNYHLISMVDAIKEMVKLDDPSLVLKALHGMKISYHYVKNNYHITSDKIAIIDSQQEVPKLIGIYEKTISDEGIIYYKAERVWN